MKTNVLIGLLADGQVHSGESLASCLGISRTAVWKQIKRASERGFSIETIRGKGYRLITPVDLLSADTILASLDASRRQQVELRVLDEVDSTNAEIIRHRPATGARVPVCLADSQTAGRGRRGREWLSPKGKNLYISFGLTCRGGFALLDGLSLVFGVAVAEALERAGLGGVRLKWPNDIVVEGSKLAGILVELQGELQEGVVQVVAGIGLNVHMTEATGVDQAWTSLTKTKPDVDWQRNRLAAELIESVLAVTERFAADGFAPFRSRWQDRDLFLDQSLVTTAGDWSGVGRGIDSAGNYLIETGDGIRTVRAGEISLRVSP